jgi:uncharacterized protein YoaH (UPF0181 family)
MSTISEKIQPLIAGNSTKEAIQLLADLLKDKEKDLYNEVVLYSARHKKLSQEIRMQTIDEASARLQLNQLNFAVLGFADSLVEAGFTLGADSVTVTNTTDTDQPYSIFVSYSHKNKTMLERLNVFLAPLRTYQQIQSWDDRFIEPGDDWESKILGAFAKANTILILCSADYFNSEYCRKEMHWAMEQNKLIIPIILEPCLWTDTPLGKIQGLPVEGKPITLWPTEAEAMAHVATALRNRLLKK